MANLLQLLAYYQDRLAVQYRTKAKARATIAITGKQVIGDALALAVRDAFNVDAAVGAQLDVLGKYIGIPRTIGQPVILPYYGYFDDVLEATDPSQNPNGMQDEDPSVNAQSIFYDENSALTRNTALDDVAYRFMLKWKIVLNASDGTLASIDALLNTLLPGYVELTDNADMSLTYVVSAALPVSPYVLQPYLPKPMGVLLNFLYLTAAVSPNPLSKTVHANAPGTVTSLAATCTPANGTGPYTYSWIRLSETRPDFPDFPGTTADSPTAAATTFTHHFGGTGVATSVSTWKCVVTDALGLVAETPVLTVTLKLDGPP